MGKLLDIVKTSAKTVNSAVSGWRLVDNASEHVVWNKKNVDKELVIEMKKTAGSGKYIVTMETDGRIVSKDILNRRAAEKKIISLKKIN